MDLAGWPQSSGPNSLGPERCGALGHFGVRSLSTALRLVEAAMYWTRVLEDDTNFYHKHRAAVWTIANFLGVAPLEVVQRLRR